MKNADISSPNTADTLLIIDDVEMNRGHSGRKFSETPTGLRRRRTEERLLRY